MFLKKPYKNVDEFYGAVEELIVAFNMNGSSVEARRLDVLLHSAWTTGSELIGELMLALADMKGPFPSDIQKRISDCHDFAKYHRRILGLD